MNLALVGIFEACGLLGSLQNRGFRHRVLDRRKECVYHTFVVSTAHREEYQARVASLVLDPSMGSHFAFVPRILKAVLLDDYQVLGLLDRPTLV